jgi:hypothetical protein
MEHDTGSGAAGPPEAEEAAATGEPAGAGEPMATGEAPGTGEPPGTGERRVDAALGRLDELDGLPLSEHPAVYEWIHEELVEVLGDLHPVQAPTDKLTADQAEDRPPAGDGSAGPGTG